MIVVLRLTIPKTVLWNDQTQEFITIDKDIPIQLEHSLLSLSKWESKWNKPFLSATERTYEETLDYIRCMTITQNIPMEYYYALGPKEIDAVNAYISKKMTATTVRKENSTTSSRIITSELIYYWMIANGIPFECQKWHLSRLLMLIDVCVAESTPPKKRSKREIAARNAEINRKRREKYAKR